MVARASATRLYSLAQSEGFVALAVGKNSLPGLPLAFGQEDSIEVRHLAIGTLVDSRLDLHAHKVLGLAPGLDHDA